jgi:hypothetical protein
VENPYKITQVNCTEIKDNKFSLGFDDLFFALVLSSTLDRFIVEYYGEDQLSTKVFLTWLVGIGFLITRRLKGRRN